MWKIETLYGNKFMGTTSIAPLVAMNSQQFFICVSDNTIMVEFREEKSMAWDGILVVGGIIFAFLPVEFMLILGIPYAIGVITYFGFKGIRHFRKRRTKIKHQFRTPDLSHERSRE